MGITDMDALIDKSLSYDDMATSKGNIMYVIRHDDQLHKGKRVLLSLIAIGVTMITRSV